MSAVGSANKGTSFKWAPITSAGVAVLVGAFLIGAAMSIGGAFGEGASGGSGVANQSPPSKKAIKLIPAAILAIDRSKFVNDQCPTLSWTIVAAIVHLESDDNRHTGGPGGNGAHPPAYGASQFQAGTWDYRDRLKVNVGKPYGEVPDGRGYAMDGDGDGIADINNPNDSIPATARMLCANGGGNPATLAQAIYSYNHVWWYVYGGPDGNGGTFQGILPLAGELDGTGEGSNNPSQGEYSNPLGGAGNPKGCPFEGTHLHPYNNWQSDNAVDIYTPIGTLVYAVDNGVISSRIGSLNSSASALEGLRLTVMANGNDFYYAHLSKLFVVAGQHVTRGEPIGRSGEANGVAHLHFAMHAVYNVARAIGLPPTICSDSNWVWPLWLPKDTVAENGTLLRTS